jgi:hypothetical protein
MSKEIYPQNEMLKGTLDIMILRILIDASRGSQMTRTIGHVLGEERGAQ